LNNEFSLSIDIDLEVKLKATTSKSDILNLLAAQFSVFKTILKELMTSKIFK
jgi:hypothetical protein